MKKILPLLAVILMMSCGHQEKDKQDQQKKMSTTFVKLGIKAAKVYQYDFVFGKANLSTAFLQEYTQLDNNGNSIYQEYRVKDDSTKENKTYVFKYNDRQQLIEHTTKDITGKIDRVTRFKYQGENNTERDFYNGDGSADGKVIYVYENNKLTETTSYNAKGGIDFRHTSTFDSDGNEKETKIYDDHGKLEERIEAQVTASSKSYQGYKNDTLEFKTVTYLNSNQQVTKREDYYAWSRKTEKKTFYYDKDNLIKEITEYDYNGEPKKLIKFFYLK